MKPVSLFGSGVKSYSQVVTSQRRLNCFYDIRQDGDKSQLIIQGTPGSFLYITMPTAPIRGWRVVKGILYVVAGPFLYSVNSLGVITKLGEVTPVQTNLVGISDNSLQLMIVDGTAGFIYNFLTTVFSTITDPNFPNGATTVAFMDGWFIVNVPNTRQFAISASYDGTVWTPSIQGAKENTSDNLVAVEVFSGLLILWGVQSIEFWQDLGLAPLPFARINGASTNWGLAALWSRSELSVPVPGSTITGTVTPVIYCLASNPSGGVQVLQITGTTLVRVSNSDIESIINSFPIASDAVGLTYIVNGHPMYQLTFPTGGRTFLFDALSSIWSETQTGLALLAPHFGYLGVVYNSINYISDATTGNIYSLSLAAYTDNGVPIKRQVSTMHVRGGGERFSIDELYLDMETGVGLQGVHATLGSNGEIIWLNNAGQVVTWLNNLGQVVTFTGLIVPPIAFDGPGVNPQIMLQTSKDGGRTFGIERWKPIGYVGQYGSPRVVWNRMGQSRDFVFQFTMTDPVKFIITLGMASSIDPGPNNG